MPAGTSPERDGVPSVTGGYLGGRFQMTELRHRTVTVLWANTTLGLLLFWWTGSVQQAGRACLTLSRLWSR